MSRLWILFVLGLLAGGPAAAQATATLGEKQVGTSGCKNGANSADFDTLAQCTSTDTVAGSFQKAPLFVGKVTAPPYGATSCDATKEGMIQYISGTGFQGCNGSSWVALSGGGGTGSVPVGSIIAWPSATDPDDMANWLECNGQTINSTDYPKLYALVGSKVPDLRGLFLRGLGSQSFSQNNGSTVGTTATLYASGTLGAVQGDAVRNMTGTLGDGANSQAASSSSTNENSGTGVFSRSLRGVSRGTGEASYSCYVQNFDASLVVPTANENRPVNMAVRYLIRSK